MTGRFCPNCMEEVNGGANFCTQCGSSLSYTAESHHMPVGTILKNTNGRTYCFGRALGEGGFGITYIGRELVSGRKVAIKEYFPMIMCSPRRMENGEIRPAPQKLEAFNRGRESFLSEASMLRALRDVPGIVHVLDYFEANGTAYIVMEYLDGRTLKDIVSSSGPMEYGRVMDLFRPLTQNLVRVHDAGVIHRDIAPDNIMLMPNGTLKLLDFGCARSIEDGRSMTVALKPGFAPIEQYTRHGQTESTDLHALCATMYYCITGRVPPAATERMNSILGGGIDPLAPISACGIAIPEHIEQAIMKGCALQPTERTAGVKGFLAEIEPASPAPEPVYSGEPTWAVPVPDDEKPVPKGGAFGEKYAKPILIAAGVVIAVLLIALIFGR